MSTGRVTLTVGAGRLRAEVRRGKRLLWAAEAEFGSVAELEDAVARLVAEHGKGHQVRALSVRLEKPMVQLRTLRDLPPVRPSVLPSVIAHQAGRFFRKNGSALVTDATWERNGRRSRAVVQAAAVEEPVVTALTSGARAAGLMVETIRPAADGPATRLSLLPATDRAARRVRARQAVLRLAGIAACLWMLAGGIWVWRMTSQRKAVELELASLQDPLRAMDALRQEMRGARLAIATIAGESARRGDALRLVAAITGALPDSAFLTALSLSRTGQVTLSGYARRATEVVARLERSGVLRGVRMEGAVGREAVHGLEWERFTVSTDYTDYTESTESTDFTDYTDEGRAPGVRAGARRRQ